MKMCDISELFPFVENFQAFDEESFPDTQVKLTYFVIWSFSWETVGIYLLHNASFVLVGVASCLLSQMVLWVLLRILTIDSISTLCTRTLVKS